MQTKPGIFVFSLLLMLGMSLAAGIGASRIYEGEMARHQALASTTLRPLPDWIADPLPDFSGYADTEDRKAAFFDYLFPRIALANRQVLAQRRKVEALANKAELTDSDQMFLAEVAERLRIEPEIGSPEFFESIDRRLDIIPPSLVLAQAANESAWGTSRFAREGNNLFGQWCFSQGCGLVPLQRGDSARHEVADFETPFQSVRSYITNLNRHPSYQDLRAQRAKLRAQDRTPTGQALAPGLSAYSERGDEYIDEILNMMRYNDLDRYDERLQEWLEAGAENEDPYIMRTDPRSNLALD
tara:strand:- start:974 stop:1870 length:897 start_codon:yes stop_codon:yes gene_type:complete